MVIMSRGWLYIACVPTGAVAERFIPLASFGHYALLIRLGKLGVRCAFPEVLIVQSHLL
jgi:hypothetical protein